MGRIEAHPRLPLREASRAFLASGSLEDLAQFISLSLQSGLTDDQVRVQIPNRLKVGGARGRYEFYSVLAKLTAVMQPELRSRNGARVDPFVKKYLSEKQKYSVFVPAWEMADLLPRVFEGRDPGAIVGQHIEQLFCRRFLEDPELHVWFEPSRPGFERALDLCVPALAVLLGDDQVPSADKAALGLIRQALEAPEEDIPLAQAVPACVESPCLRQPLFTALLNILCWNFVGFVGQEAFSKSLAHISLMSLFNGAAPTARSDWSEREKLKKLIERIRKESIKLRSKSDERNKNESPQQGNSGPGGLLVALDERYADALETRLSGAREDACIMPPQLLARLLDVDGIFEWACENEAIVAPHLQAIQTYRTGRADGAAPWEIEQSYLLTDLCSRFGVADGVDGSSDLALLLGRLWSAGRDSLGELTFLPLWIGDRSRDSSRAAASRCHEYQRLVAAAIADGLGDLAGAIQAIFLVSQSLRYRGHLGPWSVIEPMLRRTVERDEPDTVGKAIEYAAEVAKLNGLMLTRARLQHLSRKSIAIDPTLAFPVGFAVSRDDIYGKLVRQFGEPRLSKLGTRALDYLIDAHLKYASLRGRISYGEIVEWGDVGNNFRKVFESTLRQRLGPLYKDPSYERYRSARQMPGADRKGRASLANFLYFLKQYPELDQSLRVQIDEKIDYLRDSSLIEDLLKLDAEFLSEGSHDNPYPIEKAEKLTERLFAEGMLGRFADILV